MLWIEFDLNVQMMLLAVFLAVAAAAPQSQVVIVKQAQEHDTAQQKYSYRSASN